MREVKYYLADDGTKFENEKECVQYESQQKLKEHINDFQFFDRNKNPIPIEEADEMKVDIIVINTPAAATYVGEWFEDRGCYNPFCDCEFEHEVGTWVYGDTIDRGDDWFKIETEIEKLQSFLIS